MVRLVQGDVGCGKTVVAAAAAARAVGSGLQAALMAPTELLAEQHAKNFERWFRALDIPVALITGSHAGAHAAQRARDAWPVARSSWWSARTRCSRNRSSSRVSVW